MRKLTTCFALVLMLCLSGAAFAQTIPPTFCGDLSTEDCDILTNATTASATLDSALYDFMFDLNISNIPDLDEPLNFNMTGSGSFSGMAALQSYSMNMMSDMSSMMSDPTQMMQMIADLLRGLNADANITFNFPPALVEEMGGSMPDSLNLQARLVDGFAYLNMDTLAPLLGPSSNLSGWYGIDIASLYSAMGEQMGSMMGDADMSMFGANADMMQDMMGIYDPEFIGQFVSITRVDDGSGDVAVFQFDIDMGAMMGSPEFQDLMRQQMAAQADMMGSSSSMDEDDMNEALAMVSQMFKGMTFVMTEEISLTEGYVQRINGAMSFDTAGMMAAMGETSDEVPPVINITFSVGYSSFNSAPLVTAPENATIIPYQTLLGMSNMATPVPQMTPTMTATSAMATVEPTAETTSEATVEPTSEVTLEPTVEVTVEPTVEPTAEVTVVVPTLEPTVEVTAES